VIERDGNGDYTPVMTESAVKNSEATDFA
jgi:hypothetical protein